MSNVLSTVINGLFGKGGLLRVRALITLSLTGTAIFLAVTGVLPVTVFVAAWTGAMGVYIGVRAGERID